MFNAYMTNTLRYDPELCINCGMCSAVCPHGVFAPDDYAVRLIRPTACMECGACQVNCPTGAIVVDSGVGCATAMIYAALTRRKDITCGAEPEPSGSSEKPGNTTCCG
jgi:NAD-dependent dihydropyrimidine dehydrogenase PreA subunit